MSLATSSLLSTLTIKQWSARKLDKKVSEEVCAQHYADSGSGNFNKQLIPKEFLKKVQRIVNSTRNYHYENTLAWGHDGTELLPANHYLKYTQAMEVYKDEFDTAVNEFISDYPSLLTKVMNGLNDLYNSRDYPSQQDLRRRFTMDYVITPVPEQGDFRVDLPYQEMHKLTVKLTDQLNKATDLAAKDLYIRLYTVVAKAVVTLKTPGKIFRDSLITNIIELARKIPDLNFNDDVPLAQLTTKVHKLVNMIDIEALRDKKENEYRVEKAEVLTELLVEVETAFTNKWGEM